MNNRKSPYTGVFAIFIVGGLIGAALMLLLAPQSGKRTRRSLHRASNRLQRQTGRNVYRTTKKVNKFVHTFLEKLTLS